VARSRASIEAVFRIGLLEGAPNWLPKLGI
jgi:hypothetical protein